MNKNTEALSVYDTLKLALEALRDYRRSDDDRVSVAMGILQEALAHAPTEREQPAPVAEPHKQEPIAWIYKPHMELLWPDEIEVKDPSKHTGYKPVYTSPPNVPTARASKPWVGLTRDEIADLAEHYYDDKVVQVEEVIEMAEAKLREKNA